MDGGFGRIFMTPLTVMVIALLGAFRQIQDDRHDGVAGKPRAREILDRRYARGEIDAEEFQRKRGVER